MSQFQSSFYLSFHPFLMLTTLSLWLCSLPWAPMTSNLRGFSSPLSIPQALVQAHTPVTSHECQSFSRFNLSPLLPHSILSPILILTHNFSYPTPVTLKLTPNPDLSLEFLNASSNGPRESSSWSLGFKGTITQHNQTKFTNTP